MVGVLRVGVNCRPGPVDCSTRQPVGFANLLLTRDNGACSAAGVAMGLPPVWVLHLSLSAVYGMFISLFVAHLSQGRATVTGGLLGILLYLLNFGIVSLAFPAWRSNEVPVLFTHIVFGLIAGSAYRGLLRRKAVA